MRAVGPKGAPGLRVQRRHPLRPITGLVRETIIDLLRKRSISRSKWCDFAFEWHTYSETRAKSTNLVHFDRQIDL